MISYAPFWNQLKTKRITTYHLIYGQGISSNTIHRMKQGKDITTRTITEFCEILNCQVSDILTYVKESPAAEEKE